MKIQCIIRYCEEYRDYSDMKKRATGFFGLLVLATLSVVMTPETYAEDGVIIYRSEDHGRSNRFRSAERSAKSAGTYSYSQRAYQGTLIYYGAASNLNPNVYSSRVVSFFVTFENPTVIHAGHGYGDADADKRDTRIFPRRIVR